MNLCLRLAMSWVGRRVFTPPDPPVAVAWQSVTANGSDGATTSTQLTFTFDVDPGELSAANFTIDWATKGTMTGTGTTRVLPISDITADNNTSQTVTLASNSSGYTITPTSRSVTVYVEDTAPNEITFISGAANGESDVTTSNSITLTFSEDPTGLAASDITVTGATKGALSGSGTTRALAISSLSVDDSQTVNVAIADNNDNTFSPNNRDVTVYVEAVLNPPIASGTFAPPAGNVDSAYFYDASALFTGGTPTSYSLATGSLPAGVSFNTSTGVFSGTPTTEETETGVSVSATNADGSDTTNTASIVIAAAVEPTGDFILARSANTTVAGSPDYDLQITASLTTAPNPAGIVFNALTSSTFTGVDDPEKELSFWWEFDDDGAVFDYVSSDLGRNNANKAQGGITGHVFTDVGTYTVKAYCYNHDTDEYGYDEITITVTDADTYYATTDTVCLDPTGTFAGAPAGSQQVTTWNAAQTAIEVIKAGSRLLVARGQTVDLDNTSTLMSVYNNQRFGAFGTGADPIINLPTEAMDNFANSLFYGNSGTSRGTGENTVISDWDIRGNYDAELGIGEANNGDFIQLVSNSKVTIHGVQVSGVRKAMNIINIGGAPTSILVSNCKYTNWFDYGILGRGDNSVVVGSSIRQKETANSGKNSKEKFQGRITSNGSQTVYVLANIQLHGETDKYLRVFDYDPSARTYTRLLPVDDFTFTLGIDDDGNNTGNATHEIELNSAIANGHELYYHSAYYPWHGPIRMEDCQGVTISQNEFLSKNGWTSEGLAHQPCIRWNSGGNANAFGFINQNKIEGGFDMLNLAPQNSSTRQYPTGPVVVEANEFKGTTVSENCVRIGCTNVLIRNNNMIQPNLASEWENHEFQRFAIIEKYEATLTDVDSDPIDIFNNTIVNLMTTANGAEDITDVFESEFGDGFPLINSGNNLLKHADNSVTLTDYEPLDDAEYYRPEAGSAAINAGTPNVFVWDDFAGELVGANASIGSYDQPAVPAVLNEIAFSTLTANGVSDTTDTDTLTLGFDEDPTGLAASDITVTGATKGALSGTGTSRTLAISSITVADSETVNVAIADNNGNTFSPTNKDVTVYKAAAAAQRLTLNGVDSKFSFPDKTLGDGDSVSFTFNSTDFSCYLLGRDAQTQHFITTQNGNTIRVRAVTNHYFDVADGLDDGEDHTLTYTHQIGTAPTLTVDGTPYTERDGTVGTTALILNQSNFGNDLTFNTISHTELTFIISATTTKWNIDSGSITTEAASVGTGDMTFTNVISGDWV